MKSYPLILFIAVQLTTGLFAQQPRRAAPGGGFGPGASGTENPFAFLEDRLVLGIRVLRHTLSESSRPEDPNRQETFLGFINELDLQSDQTFALFAEYHVNPYVFLELSHDRIEARTKNFNNQLSDGNVEMSGLIFSVNAQYTVYDRITPFAGIGLAPWSASFNHDAWWTLGWPSPEAYNEAGRPGTDRGRRRVIDVGGSTGIVYTAGVRFEPADHFQISVLARYIDIETDATFLSGPSNNLTPQLRGDFPLSHRSFGITLAYRF
ncbi:MAG: outer membrane beta-barrel protein [Verrucomicrobia bacterium]|nr:outer membrane beta-barrel protein [Verrucomicrobiota bacterium]MCH8525819.1 porin family protein [Kiritimatiellia bacterium]